LHDWRSVAHRQSKRINMRRTIHAAAAALMAWSAGGTLAAHAADLSLPPVYQPDPSPIVELGSGWYLRADMGYVDFNAPGPGVPPTVDGQHSSATAAAIFSNNDVSKSVFGATLGAGYQFNPMFRMDATIDYRQQLSYQNRTLHSCVIDNTVNGVVLLGNNGDCYAVDKVTTSSWTGLLNAYLDIGTWYGFTPYIGGGLGVTHLEARASENWYWTNGQPYGDGNNSYQSHSSDAPGYYHYGYLGNVGPSEVLNNFSFALMAGASYDVSQYVKLDIGYRYLNLGQVTVMDAFGNTTHRTIDTQEVRVGVRITPDG
jgi:opacity protein-like surface antigen